LTAEGILYMVSSALPPKEALKDPFRYQMLVLVVLVCVAAQTEVVIASDDISTFNRNSFPAGFVFGTASSSYQYEGAAKEGGRGPSIWDYFTHKYPGRIANGSNGDVAIDFYHKYKALQKGKIGITLVSHWMVPYSNSVADKNATQRAIDFMFGWFMDPLTFGDYPQSMRDLVGKRLPKFTEEQTMLVKGSLDFLGLNYYTAFYAVNNPVRNATNLSYSTDSQVNLTPLRDGVPIGPPQSVCIAGIDEVNNSTLTLEEALKDPMRIGYYYSHLRSLKKAIE
ncbi:Glycoside hydrolase family 1, partial [Dillenia turbinata]